MKSNPQNSPAEPLLHRYEALLEVSEVIAAHRDLAALFGDLAALLRRVVEFDGVATFLHDPARGVMRIHLLESNLAGLDEIQNEIAIEQAPAGWVWQHQEPLLIADIAAETRYPLISEVSRQVGVRSYCILPLTSAGRRLGALGFGSLRVAAYDEGELVFLQQIANHVAIAVDNALNFERARKAEQEARRQSDRLSLVLRINNAVISHLDLRGLLRAISGCLREMVGHDTTSVALYDPESDKLRIAMTDYPEQMRIVEENYLIPLEGSMTGLAFTSGQPFFCDQFDLERFPADFTRRAYEAGLRSCGNIPLIAHGRKLGALGVASRRPGAFSADDIELLCQSADQIALAVENALAYREIETLKNKLNEEKLYLEDEIRSDRNFEEIIGASSTLKRILKQIETVAPTDSAVLIRGETGTGKELVARAIHTLSARRERTMVKLNCAAIPTGLLESELFGHEKGAFTGAIAQRIGRFELAHKGTLFLDEVGDIPLELQPKLLRVLQEQEFERLGSARTQRVDVRLVAATNCDLEQMVADKQFRGDLFYRLNVFPLTIPPLRERREDIPLLVRSFAQRFAHRMKKRIDRIPTETMTALTQYHWPGNVRELENLIERAVILSLGPELEISIAELKPAAPAEKSGALTLEAAEREHILRVLRETDWVISGPAGAAARLGMNRTTLQSRMRKLGIARPK